MTELNQELEMIKRMQLREDERNVVSRCENIDEQTLLSKLFLMFCRYPLLLVLVVLGGIGVLALFGNPLDEKGLHGASYAAPLLFFVLIFVLQFYLWIIIKKLSLRIKFLEKKLDDARQALN